MGFQSRTKILFDANMQLNRTQPEPTTTTGTQWLGLFDLFQCKETAEKIARLRLAAWRRGDLNVIDAQNPHVRYFEYSSRN